jgi:hypothetical protein
MCKQLGISRGFLHEVHGLVMVSEQNQLNPGYEPDRFNSSVCSIRGIAALDTNSDED